MFSRDGYRKHRHNLGEITITGNHIFNKVYFIIKDIRGYDAIGYKCQTYVDKVGTNLGVPCQITNARANVIEWDNILKEKDMF